MDLWLAAEEWLMARQIKPRYHHIRAVSLCASAVCWLKWPDWGRISPNQMLLTSERLLNHSDAAAPWKGRPPPPAAAAGYSPLPTPALPRGQARAGEGYCPPQQQPKATVRPSPHWPFGGSGRWLAGGGEYVLAGTEQAKTLLDLRESDPGCMTSESLSVLVLIASYIAWDDSLFRHGRSLANLCGCHGPWECLISHMISYEWYFHIWYHATIFYTWYIVYMIS